MYFLSYRLICASTESGARCYTPTRVCRLCTSAAVATSLTSLARRPSSTAQLCIGGSCSTIAHVVLESAWRAGAVTVRPAAAARGFERAAGEHRHFDRREAVRIAIVRRNYAAPKLSREPRRKLVSLEV